VKKKLAGKYYFEWLGRVDRKYHSYPVALKRAEKWQDWARRSYANSYYFGDL